MGNDIMSISQLLKKWRNGKTSPEEYKQLVSALDSLTVSAYLCGNRKAAKEYSNLMSEVLRKGN